MPELTDEVKNKESRSFMDRAVRLGFNSLIAVGATGFGIATTGVSAPLIGGALAVGSILADVLKAEKSFDDILVDGMRAYSVVNTIISPVIGFGNISYPFVDQLANVYAGASDLVQTVARTAYAVTVHNIVFQTLYGTADHLLINYFDPTGLGKSLASNWGAKFARGALLFGPGWHLTANGIFDLNFGSYKFPVFGANAAPFGFVNNYWPIAEKTAHSEPNPGMPQIPQMARG